VRQRGGELVVAWWVELVTRQDSHEFKRPQKRAGVVDNNRPLWKNALGFYFYDLLEVTDVTRM
jgi:hypothetical protein